jgi:hypothetical protein
MPAPSCAYASQHHADVILALRDNCAAATFVRSARRSRRRECSPSFWVLDDASGIPVWSSGGTDRRVISAIVRDDGRLILMDSDGYVRWSTDPLATEDLAAYRWRAGTGCGAVKSSQIRSCRRAAGTR